MDQDYSAAQVMAAISAALNAGDMEAAAALMPMFGTRDPAAAQMILDALELLSALGDPDAERSQEER